MSYTPNIENRIIVKRAEQLDTTLRSDVVYYIDGLIDMGTIEIVVPSGGLFLTGVDYFKSGLYSTADNYTMFKTAVGIPTSNIRIQELNFWASGVNSKLFDLDGTGNFGAIEFNSCNLGDFTGTTTEIGELTGFRQFRTNDSGFFLVQDGLTFSGTWAGGFRIGDSIALSTAANVTLFKEGTSLLFQGRCISDINASSLNNTTIIFGFQESNFQEDGAFQLNGASFNRDAPAVTMSENSTKAFFKDCVGIRNTRPGFEMEFTTPVLTPLTVNTPTKILGTTTTTNNTWWTQTDNNEITYDSNLVRDFEVIIPLEIDGGANDELALELRRWDDSLGSFEIIKTKVRNVSNLIGGLDKAIYNLVATVRDVEKNDFLTLYKENRTDGTDATTLVGSEMICKVI